VKTKVINFAIDQEQRLKIIIPCLPEELFSMDWVDVVYENKKEDFFNHKLELHPSITKDIGYLWNEKLSGSSSCDLVLEEIEEGQKAWVGQQFLIWCGRSLTTWMYTKNGILFLEITPSYKWHFRDPKPEDQDQFVSYEKFKENYKPFLIAQININTAREWLKQTDRLLKIIHFNADKYRAEQNLQDKE
jgi:hypothetical protein